MNFIKWNTGAYDAAAAAALAKELGVSSLAAKVLCARGLTEAQAARTFLDISPAALSDPMLLKDMDRAVERIERALLSMGEAELNDMIAQQHGAQVGCQFCNRKYDFTEDELRALIREGKGE